MSDFNLTHKLFKKSILSGRQISLFWSTVHLTYVLQYTHAPHYLGRYPSYRSSQLPNYATFCQDNS